MLTTDSQNKLLNLLEFQEGNESKPYQDIYGNWTVGIGWNLTQMPMTKEQARYMCNSHMQYFNDQLNNELPFYSSLSEVRKAVLIDMAFQLGMPRFQQFKKFINLLSVGTYFAAAQEMLDSKWARDFPPRAKTLSQMMSSNMWPS